MASKECVGKADGKRPRVTNALKNAISIGTLSEENPAVMFFDISRYDSNLTKVVEAFQSVGINDVVHAAAVKSNPLTKVLEIARDKGLGAECASLSEVVHSLKLGFPPNKIVYDSPCKTRREIEYCLSHGVRINMDNLQEVELVSKVLLDNPLLEERARKDMLVGLRINPQVGAGSIAETSTATATSKFGVGMTDYQESIYDVVTSHPFIMGLHVHVGSQGCEVQLLVDGVRALVDVALALNKKAGFTQIKVLDIGGGLPVNYDGDEDTPTYLQYATALKHQVPELCTGSFHIITEFGRSLVQKCGWVASRVEYLKVAGGQHIATIHVGSNLFLRTAYLPEKWRHYITAHEGSTGSPLPTGETKPYNIAGPLCFSGDMLANQRVLPTLSVGDVLVIHDAGGYTLSMYSRYNSRPAPAVYGHTEDGSLTLFKRAETIEESLAMWEDK